MATNRYFSDLYTAKNEDQTLAEDIIIESIQIHGRDMYYLPRDLNNFDSFFGEDQVSSFRNAIAVEFFPESIMSWQDDGSFLSKFGMEIRDSATFAVAIKRFKQEITGRFPEIVRPREGDILVLPETLDHRKRCMEITFVKNEEIFYQLGKLYIYTITVKNFEYTGETFETGITEIDDYAAKYSLTTEVNVAAGAGEFVAGETVSQVSGFEGMVVSFANNVLILSGISGEISEAVPLIGSTSSCSRNIASVGNRVGNDSMLNDNQYLEEKTTDPDTGIISFDETNPLLS